MTVTKSALCQIYRFLGVLLRHPAKALRARAEAIRWRRRILRALDQRRRS